MTELRSDERREVEASAEDLARVLNVQVVPIADVVGQEGAPAKSATGVPGRFILQLVGVGMLGVAVVWVLPCRRWRVCFSS